MLTVAEFAERKEIGVQRVHQLLDEGLLPHKKYGNRVLIYGEALKWRPRRSRPLAERMREALAAELCGVRQSEPLSGNEQFRLRKHLTRLEHDNGAQLFADLFAGRGRLHRYRVHPEDIRDLREDERILLSGISHGDSNLAAEDFVEGYVRQENLNGLMRNYLLEADPVGQVKLRIGEVLPELLSAYSVADLADWESPRELREAERVLSKLLLERRQREACSDRP